VDPDDLEVARRVYHALENDDVAGLLRLCSEDIEWRYPAESLLGYGGVWTGPDATVRFLDAHDAAEEVLDFRVDDLVAGADRVLGLGFFRGRAKDSGTIWQTRFVHDLTIRTGKLVVFEAYFDTAAAVAAHRRA
jgi:ketosteroid isomerase-like protein